MLKKIPLIQPTQLLVSMERPAINRYTKEVAGNFTTMDGKYAVLSNAVKTGNINTCTGVVFHTPQINEMHHLAPEYSSHQDPIFIRDFFQERIYELQKSYGEVKAFIFGGRGNDKQSFNLANNIANPIEDAGVEFSMLFGKKKFNTHDQMAITENKLSIWNDGFAKLFKKSENVTDNKKVKFLEDNYEIVYTNGDDFLTIGK